MAGVSSFRCGYLIKRNIFCEINQMSIYRVLRRQKHKKKWASTKPETSSSDHALAYFDSFYKPVYGRLWPSMRVALLSQQKYSALLNNFCNTDDVIVDLITNGADDITKLAREKNVSVHTNKMTETESLVTSERAIHEVKAAMLGSPGGERTIEEVPPSNVNVVGAAGLYDYMPTQRVVNDNEELHQQEIDQGFYTGDGQLNIPILPSPALHIPVHLQVFAKPRGDVSLFPRPTMHTSEKLSYYLFDAASVLPVLALGLQPKDDVLDLCAAPGGKSLAILQTMLVGSLVCMDRSYSRMQRLKDVLRWYLPQSYTQEKAVETVHIDGIRFCHEVQDTAHYDKILVDVPCYTDRHVLLTEENNLFQTSRQKERLMIQETQKKLLLGALKLLRPGGVAVYSTCTLAAPQNDGIIQAVLEEIWTTTNLDIVVMDTSEIRHCFEDNFNFYQHCRYGQLVIPNLTANFGPMYFCKLHRRS